MASQEQRDPVAERVARNDAIFREANERIRAAAASMQLEQSDMLPFLCECADESCTTIIKLTTSEYEAVRGAPTLFINAKGHHVNAEGWGRVVDEFDRYSVIEKLGDAGEIVLELDPRGGVSS
jgi:thioesterase domain-containing protein